MTNLECNNTMTPEQLATAATEQAAFFRAMNNTEQANTLQALAQGIRDLIEDKYELQTSYDVLGGVKELLRMEKERLDAEVDDLRRQLAEAQAENDAFRKAWNFEELTKPLKEQLAEAQARLAELAKYFTSGNCVPVERATILAKDFWRICGTKAHSPADQKDAARVPPIETAPMWCEKHGAQACEECSYQATKSAAMLAASPDGKGECKCDLRQKLVGDGCHVCNPEYADDHAAPPDSPAHRAAKVLREALERFISDGVSESYICACHRPSGHVCNRCREIAKQNPLRTALATAKQIMDEAEATKCPRR